MKKSKKANNKILDFVKNYKVFLFLIILGWVAFSYTSFTAAKSYDEKTGYLSVDSNDINFKVTNVTYDDSGSEPFIAPTDWKFAIVDVELTNNSSYDFHFAPVLQTYIADNLQAKYEMSPAFLSNPIEAGPIKPGETRTGSLSYLVPKNESNLTMHFNAE